MADKSTADKLRAKGFGSITIGDITFLFINRRNKTPTILGYLTLVFIGYLVVVSLRETNQPRRDLEDVHVNPKFLMAERDPEIKEYIKVMEESLKSGKPRLPLFDPNKHKDDVHPARLHKKKADLDRYGYPNPKQFPVDVIAQPNLSCPGDKGLLLLVVASHPDNGGGRNAIRATWGVQEAAKYPTLGDGKWKTIFVMGKAENEVFDNSVLSEADTHRDMLVADFRDTPHEETRKFMLAMTWVKEHLQGCDYKFVMKSRDDIYHNMVSIVNWLEAKYLKDSASDLYVGKLLRMDRPVRDTRDPLYVPESDFKGDFFPNLIHGPLYLFTKVSFLKLGSQMVSVTPIAMEDAYVGLVAQKANISPTHNDHFQLLGKTDNVCHHLRIFFMSPVLPSEHVTIFKRVKSARISGECKSAQWVDEEGKHRDIDI